MTPERLAHIEVQLRRHPTSPHTVELALEVVKELGARLEVDRVRNATVGQISAPTPETVPHVPVDVAVAIDPPARKGKR